MPLRVFPEAGMRLELAARDFGIPIRAAQLVLEQLEAVQPVLDVVAVDDEPRRVPFAAGVDVAGRGRIEVVGRARRRHARLAIRVLRVIQDLHFHRVPVDLVAILAGAIEDTAVAAGLDLPVNAQLEILELVGRDDVATGADPRERAILHRPAVGDRRLAVVAPASGCLAIEQQAPTGGSLTIAHCVLESVGGGWWRSWRL